MPRERKPGIYSRPGTAVLQLRWYDEEGHLHRRSAETSDPIEAQRKLDDILKKIGEPAAQPLPIDAGFTVFLTNKPIKESTRKRYETSLSHLIEYCDRNAITDFRQMTKKVISAFIDWRKRRGSLRNVKTKKAVTDATIKRDILFLSSAWHYLLDHPDWEDEMPQCPISKGQKKSLRDSMRRVRFLSADEWERLKASTLNSMHLAVIVIAVETGLREQELLSLTWDMVDLDQRQIVLTPVVSPKGVKNDSARTIPLSPTALNTLRHSVPRGKRRHVFWRTGEDGRHVPFKTVNGFWRGIKKRSGVPNLKFHDLRHTFASNFLAKGGGLKHLQEIMGHSTLKQTEGYAHLASGSLRAEMDRINRIHEPTRTDTEETQ